MWIGDNIASFKHLLGKVDFDAVVDHLAITQIMRSKVEPATNRIKRLLEVLSSYSFNLYYIKGKDMVLSDFLSRQEGIDGDPKEIIPISFSLKSVLQDKYYNIDSEEKFMVQTRSQTKASGIRLPEVHGAKKRLDPHKIPEKIQPPIERVQIDRKPRLGEGRAGLRRKVLPIRQPKPIVIDEAEAVTVSKGRVPRTVEREIMPPHYIPEQRLASKPPDYIPEQRLPPKPPDITTKQQKKDADLEIEENSPFQESIISEVYERPDKSYFQELVELKDLINTKHIIHKFLPQQADIDKILDIIKRKVLKGMHLPLTIKEIQAGYLSSKYFKDIYQYLAQNRLPNKRIARKKVEMLAERYILLDSLLFKIIVVSGEEEKVMLAIPESCADKIITLYHASLFGGHQGVIKTYLTISDKFFIPNLIHYLRSYIKGCHTCQLYKKINRQEDNYKRESM